MKRNVHLLIYRLHVSYCRIMGSVTEVFMIMKMYIIFQKCLLYGR